MQSIMLIIILCPLLLPSRLIVQPSSEHTFDVVFWKMMVHAQSIQFYTSN